MKIIILILFPIMLSAQQSQCFDRGTFSGTQYLPITHLGGNALQATAVRTFQYAPISSLNMTEVNVSIKAGYVTIWGDYEFVSRIVKHRRTYIKECDVIAGYIELENGEEVNYIEADNAFREFNLRLNPDEVAATLHLER